MVRLQIPGLGKRRRFCLTLTTINIKVVKSPIRINFNGLYVLMLTAKPLSKSNALFVSTIVLNETIVTASAPESSVDC